ncbi:MAG: hypothetical protein HYT12_00910 [Candidatus Liptonbacteria bacterium]|nr:hypothetical protein [Candidatus Liptonbacteria bacterium]
MLFTTHAIVGTAIGAALQDPSLGFLGGFLSHHILDGMPHFDQGSFYTIKSGAPYLGQKRIPEEMNGGWIKRDWNMLFADWFLSGIAFVAIFYYSPLNFWVPLAGGALGGLMPDIIDSSPLWSKGLRAKIKSIAAYHKFHTFFHWTVTYKEMLWGVATQLAVILISLIYIALYMPR